MAFLKCKCPRCRSGKIFTHPFYSITNFSKFHETCPVCGLRFEKETGFFWAAMYISYGINVAIGVTMFVAMSILFDDLDTNTYIIAILAAVLLLSTLIFRYSRMIALYTFSGYKYDPSFVKK